ncbi:sulfurtransferase [Uliginosibacterium sp. 31-16]|uniref:sulfurtransferase n=1 Tax=Uliginosibacterium sp. 31-16 TaxID=3068315 RepID=UPI00273F5316|nr:sulfurtransferase [Uliginosibacterium sp. 31-16]MDP5239698.1 sulfurtransferase [Uliginosibacterium sp. 31-16]
MSFTTLVSAETLQANLGNPDWIVFDVRHDLGNLAAGRLAYAAGHIPGALFLHMDEDLSAAKTGRNGRHPLPDRADFAARLAQLGVNATSQVVVYDAQGGMTAARLWWMLRWLGHEAVAMLDGGLPAWQALGGSLEAASPGARPTGTLQLQASLVTTASAAEVLANLDTQARQVIDARGPDRFRGENETMDPVGGHIPGARNRCFRDNLQADNRFKPADVLRHEFAAVLQDTPASKVIAQCGSGVTACHNLLAMQIAGLPGAALYPGSWSEWCSDPARPVATGE